MRNKPPAPRERLLVLTSTFPNKVDDGSPPFVLELCRHLSREFEVWILAPSSPGAARRDNWDGIEIVRYRYFYAKAERLSDGGGIMATLKRHPARFLLVPFFMLGQFLAILQLLKNRDIKLIHAHWLIPQGFTAVLARMLIQRRIAVLCTAHGSDLNALRGRLFVLLQRFIVRHADATTVVSEPLRQRLLGIGVPPGLVTVLPMGIDATQRFTPDSTIQRSNDEILFVGRLVAEKDVATLLSAFGLIAGDNPDLKLTIIGTGPLENILRALCGELGIIHRVHFAGAIAHKTLPTFYRRATMLVLPSTSEGFGLSCAEAMACGCPVVVSDIEALRTLVKNGEAGLLFRVGDAQDLGDKLKTLLADRALQAHLSHKGREHIVQWHDWESAAARYRVLLRTLESKANRPI